MRPRRGSGTQPRKLGTFIGVFTPSILTILGVILFLRTGWVVGNVGLIGAIAIVVIAHAVTFATAFSVSTVATNMRVGAGGRLLHHLAQPRSRDRGGDWHPAVPRPGIQRDAIRIRFRREPAADLARTFLSVRWPPSPFSSWRYWRPGAPVSRCGCSCRSWVGIVSGTRRALHRGRAGKLPETVDVAALPSGLGFWPVFAVFFPAVTGIMAGVSLSGDLKRPERSIPRGSIAAVLVGFLVYLGVVVGTRSGRLAAGAHRRQPHLVHTGRRFRISHLPRSLGSHLLIGGWEHSRSSKDPRGHG